MSDWLTVQLLTLGAVTLAAFRATLSTSTRLVFFALGAVLGLAALPLVRAVTATGPEWLRAALSILALCLPALAVLHSPHRLRYSVTDTFLMAFLVGWGCDAATTLLNPELLWSLVPPVVKLNGVLWAGHGPWCGLVGLAAAAGRRFTLFESWSQVWTVLALGLTVADQARLLPSPLTLNGQLLWWVAPLGALLAGEQELAWLKRSPAYPNLRSLPDLQVPDWSAGVQHRLQAARRVRQVMLERAELLKLGYTSFTLVQPEAEVKAPPDLLRYGLGALALTGLALGASPLWGWLAVPGILWCFLR
ncbi:MAG: hypothetical protein AB1758_30340, partial [Candidatus Eremiobacterota bacterium]